MKIEQQVKRKSIRNNHFIEKTVREAKARAKKQNPRLFEVRE
jgi:GTP cyclohydrolase FolE2